MPDTVLITGASSGIGRALAKEFSKRGYALGLCARRLYLLENLQKELSQDHAVEIAELDVSKFETVKEVFKETFKEKLKESFKETLKEAFKETVKETFKEAFKEILRNLLRKPLRKF